MLSVSLPAQYYLTGEVKGFHGDKLQNVAITVLSTGVVHLSGLSGEFRIISLQEEDTLTFSADGYETYTTGIHTMGFLQVTLKMIPFPRGGKEGRLSSIVRIERARDSVAGGGGAGGTGPVAVVPVHGGPSAREASYNSRVENPFVTQPATVSFRGSINLASYSTIRRFLAMGTIVPPDAVKIEEMLNYFNFYYQEPLGSSVFQCSSDLVSCPWNPAHRLLFLRVCARKVNIATKPPCNLVLLIDASGSMDMPDKLPLVKSGIRLLVDNLRDIDTVSLVEYGGVTRVVFAGLSGADRGKILKAIEGLRPDGPSPGIDGIRTAYKVARHQFIPGGKNSVVLITDGDITTGIEGDKGSKSEEKELETLIDQQFEGGIHLTCGGLGMKSYKDSRLPLLAETGHGNFAYLDEEEEVEQLLAGELDESIGCVADNVSITAEFNPLLVSQYRLIGFDNKRSALEDPASGLEGCRTGSAHSQLALFELEPKTDTTGADTIARVKINYCLPGQNVRHSMSYGCPNDPQAFDKSEIDLKRAACIALFGMKLQGSGYDGGVGWPELEKMAKKTFAGNNFLDDEYIGLVIEARKIYEGKKE